MREYRTAIPVLQAMRDRPVARDSAGSVTAQDSGASRPRRLTMRCRKETVQRPHSSARGWRPGSCNAAACIDRAVASPDTPWRCAGSAARRKGPRVQEKVVTGSIGSSRDTMGARAAQHVELAFRGFTVGHGAELGTNFLRWVTREAHPLGNVAIVSASDDVDATRAAVAPLAAGDLPSAALFPHGVSAAAARSVASFGFEDQGAMPAMAVDIARMSATTLPPGYVATRIGERGDARGWREAFAIGYGLPTGLARMFSPEVLGADVAAEAQTQYFAIVRDGRTVATSLLYLADGLAGIYCVATVPEERGKGLGAHVTAEALRAAHGVGYRVGVLQSSPAGHNVYLRLGFEDLGTVPMFVRMPA